MRYAFFLLSAVLSCVAVSFAADSAATPVPASITWSGFVDAYYSKNLTARNVNQRVTEFRHQREPVCLQPCRTRYPETSFTGRVPHGPRFWADERYRARCRTIRDNPYNTLSILQQAYLTAILPVGSGLTVDVGKFVTHMGYEVIESKDNWNYSRSFMFAYAIPYYHTGARASYTFSSTFSAAVHFVNGWNSYIDNNRSTSLGLMLNYAVTPSTDIIFNGMDGFERPFNTPYGSGMLRTLLLRRL